MYVDRPFKRVLSVMPTMYDDIWTAAKGMYKMEPAIADGGEVIIYAPHITEVSYTHGHLLDQVGYHVRDYFLKQWDAFKHVPGGVLAHSTHLRGIGTYENGVEKPRIKVTLATGIPEERCRRINLGYMDPASVDVGRLGGPRGRGHQGGAQGRGDAVPAQAVGTGLTRRRERRGERGTRNGVIEAHGSSAGTVDGRGDAEARRAGDEGP